MAYNTKIDWCDTSWNPVTGCYHGCDYCYARGIAKRYGGYNIDPVGESITIRTFDSRKIIELENQVSKVDKNHAVRVAPYPYEFMPTFHRYRLEQPMEWTQPRTIFVCSMADLFGNWVPDEWITEVFDACARAPWHRYLFLTKNPSRYIELSNKGLLPTKHWYGYSATTDNMLWKFNHAADCPVKNLFISIEPIHGNFTTSFSSHCPADWIIVGAETGNRKNIIRPEHAWIMGLLRQCEYSGKPIFMKDSLKELMGDDFKQQFPWRCEYE